MFRMMEFEVWLFGLLPQCVRLQHEPNGEVLDTGPERSQIVDEVNPANKYLKNPTQLFITLFQGLQRCGVGSLASSRNQIGWMPRLSHLGVNARITQPQTRAWPGRLQVWGAQVHMGRALV